MFKTYILLNITMALGVMVSCKSGYEDMPYHKEFSPDVNFSTDLYVGNHIESEGAEHIGSAIGLSAQETKALKAAIREHEIRMQRIANSDYAPYLQGILNQNENEHYRNSIIETLGMDGYRKWFDYDRQGLDRNLKACYGFDDERLAAFKEIVREYDISTRGILRQFWPKEKKEEAMLPVIAGKDSIMKIFTGSDIPFEDILMRSKEIKY